MPLTAAKLNPIEHLQTYTYIKNTNNLVVSVTKTLQDPIFTVMKHTDLQSSTGNDRSKKLPVVQFGLVYANCSETLLKTKQTNGTAAANLNINTPKCCIN